jgi:endonuclease/exonuclease/phosphatase family metal-dependent hydrolase
MRMHVATYNIHRGFGRDGRYAPQRILRVLQELDADIIALQEVAGQGPGTIQLLPWLAAKANMTAVAGPVRSGLEGDYGNALLTRLPVQEVRRWNLSVGVHEPRGLLDVDINWNGHSVQVLNTHLGLWPLERVRQVERLLELVDVNKRDLTVLMGDLNEWYVWGESFRMLRRVFGRTEAPKTFPSRWPLLALDRIWVSPAPALVEVRAHDTHLSETASDHLPVKAEIALGGAMPDRL